MTEQVTTVRSNKSSGKKQCEICGHGRIVVFCQYCGKGLCNKCYGSWTVARKCCGQEDEIFEKTQRKAAQQ